MTNKVEFWLEVTYNGLWELWRDTDQHVQRIEAIAPDERGATNRLSYPLLLKERSRLWDKITNHVLWKTGNYL